MEEQALNITKQDILGLDRSALKGVLDGKFDLSPFRSRQLFSWIYRQHTSDFSLMTNLSKSFREQLNENFFVSRPKLKIVKNSVDGSRKYLFILADGSEVESVLICQPKRFTLCVSSQVGCAIGCKFCRTAQMGLKRNLLASEIVGQVMAVREHVMANPLQRQDETFQNIVFMGMGEPLANYAKIMDAIRTMIEPQPNGLGMSARQITVSTVGLVPGIVKLAEEDLPLTFALSLHAPDDQLRDELIPVNSKWKVDEALDAAKAYYDKTGRRVSIEYALIHNMNDHDWRAQLLADKLNDRGKGWVHVNPIPLNPTPGSVWTSSTKEQINSFIDILDRNGIPTTLRDTRGKEIDGACGQLAAAN